MVSEWPEEFGLIASAGYYIALHVGFAFPMEERNTYPAEWVARYTREGLMLRDPVVHWVYGHTGYVRWSDLEQDDPHGIFGLARSHGLNYGVAIGCTSPGPDAQRSYGSFARADRELTRTEIQLLTRQLRRLHNSLIRPVRLTAAELEALRLVRDGLRLKEIAFRLGVSEGAIKQRLAGAKRKLGARTNSQAATMAQAYRLI